MSRELKGKRIILWPVNIDAAASRSEGRKIAKKYAVRRPRVEEIVEAAKRLGLNPEVEDARYPRQWWQQRQRIIVDKMGSKLETLKTIAKEIEKLREERKLHGH